jgi:enoyl-CoA hydratase/carnithine racemase
VLENIANIRVPVIAAVEGRAHIHSDYALLASVIVAAEGATFQDVGHFAVGVTPGDGRIVREVGYGLSLEGASSAALVISKQSKSEALTQRKV